MRDNFDKAFLMLCNYEGYSSDLKGDPGGRTIWGVSERYFPLDLDAMSKLTPEGAKAYARSFYKMKFWDALNCDDIPQPYDMIVFDAAVNPGPHFARKAFMESSNACLGCRWRDFLFKRIFYYILLVGEQPAKLQFLKGWINRTLTAWVKFK